MSSPASPAPHPHPAHGGRRTMAAVARAYVRRAAGFTALAVLSAVALSLLTWSVADPSLTHSADGPVRNLMGPLGAIIADVLVQTLGLASVICVVPPAYWAIGLAMHGVLVIPRRDMLYVPLAVALLALSLSSIPSLAGPLRHGYGGLFGDLLFVEVSSLLAIVNASRAGPAAGLIGLAVGLIALQRSFGLRRDQWKAIVSYRSRSTAAADSVHVSQATSHPNAYPTPYLAADLPWPTHPAVFAPSPAVFAPSPAVFAPSPAIFAQSHDASSGHREASTETRTAQFRPAMPPGIVWPTPPHQPAPVEASNPDAPVRSTTTRQAWLRPFPHRPAVAIPTAPEADQIVPATSRSHVPDFDRETLEQSGSVAARFAPAQAPGAKPVASDVAQHTASRMSPPRAVEPVRAPNAKPAVAVAPAAQPQPAAPAKVHSPSIIRPDRPDRAETDRTLPIVAGGFYDRLTGGAGRPEQRGTAYKRPSLGLLKRVATPGPTTEASAEQLRQTSHLLLETLADFGVKGDIVAVRPGPVVTLFEFAPARGTKSSRVIGLSDDLARSMGVRAVRIAVVPGIDALGIELPNVTREPVTLRDLLDTEQFHKSAAKLPLALGKSISGAPVIADLARMPHLLVAGTTGAGKSVGINAMILSLLYRLSPAECRLILIDPKMLELSVYNGIPHLLAPVVTDPAKAVAALEWAVAEMETRYRRMSAQGVRNIEGYNARLRETQDIVASETRAPMPHIVVVVDEFADLMTVAGKEIEIAVQRLAQMARAAGIHLVMATQRPSVDIITGTIKSNFPVRLSFRVASRIDSRTILNEAGAEQLLGQGDMLYASGGGETARLHGPFVSDAEVEAVTAHLRSQGAPDYVAALASVTT